LPDAEAAAILPARVATLRRILGHPAVLFLLCLGMVVATAWPLAHAGWGPIDDHEIAEFLGPTHHLGFHRFWQLLVDSEAGHPGGFVRYRPSYYFFRLLETALWGNHPHVWYVARIVMFAFSLASLTWLLRSLLSPVENLLLVVWLLTLGFWIDIWARLGPAETYGVFGLALYAVGFDHLFRTRRAPDRLAPLTSALMLLGGVMCVGTKENFVLLLFPVLLLLVLELRGARRRSSLICSGLLLSFIALVLYGTVLSVKRHGTVYRDDASAGHRYAVLMNGVRMVWDWSHLVLYLFAALFVVALVVAHLRGKRRELLRLTGIVAAAEVVLGGLFVSQYVFYDGRWPSGAWCCGRYDFPGILTIWLAYYFGYYWMVATARLLGAPAPAVIVARVGAAAALLWMIHGRTFPLYHAALHTVDETTVFTTKLERLAVRCNEHPDWPVVFDSHDVWDYEPIESLQKFLAVYGVHSPVFLRLEYSSNGFAPGSLEHQLTTTMEKRSREGGFMMLRPYGELHGEPCLGVGLHGPASICTPTETFP
jgi:hypothetical protein